MPKAFSHRDGVVHLCRMPIACAMFACMLALGVAVPEMAIAENNPQFQPILCEPDRNDTFNAAECLRRFKEFVTRDGDVLRLKLENGRTKVYAGTDKNCEEHADECLIFRLVAFYPSLQSFLVERGLFECAYYELVSRRTGSIAEFSTIPEWSPNGKYLVAVDQNDLCERYYDLAIWSATDPPVLELKRHHERYYENWTIVGWDGDDRIRLHVDTNGNEGSYDQDVEAIRSGSGWKLVWGSITNVKPREPASSQWPPAAPPPAHVPVPGAGNR